MPLHTICLDCGHTTPTPTKGRCAACAAAPARRDALNRYARRGGQTNPVTRLHSSTAWRKLRTVVRARDGNACTRCGATHNLTVHHIVPLRHGGPALDPDNLTTLCTRCHGHTEAAQGGARAQTPQGRQFRGSVPL